MWALLSDPFAKNNPDEKLGAFVILASTIGADFDGGAKV
jgi:hypothetical protein